jgi:hypothetical protein
VEELPEYRPPARQPDWLWNVLEERQVLIDAGVIKVLPYKKPRGPYKKNPGSAARRKRRDADTADSWSRASMQSYVERDYGDDDDMLWTEREYQGAAFSLPAQEIFTAWKIISTISERWQRMSSSTHRWDAGERMP